MLHVGRYVFKCADTKEEIEQIHRLNYKTFVGEIAQYTDDGAGFLIDKFHDKNAYFIVLKDDRVIGMVSLHDQPPFSISERLDDPSILARPGTRPVEVRLLAIEPRERQGTVFFGLIHTLYSYAVRNGYTHLFISGVQERLDLYERLGFVALGPAVLCGKASFVPMVLPTDQLPFRLERMKQMWEQRCGSRGEVSGRPTKRPATCTSPSPTLGEVCLLPGPVMTSTSVREAFQQPPTYHRGPEFIRRFMNVRRLLGEIVGGRDVAILNGSGTLANEAIAATLAAIQRDNANLGRGLLLINGEFGERLARQATRFGLQPRLLSWEWGQTWNLEQVDAALADEPPGSWVWGVHQESSTGVLNDLNGLVSLAKRRGIRVCLDCISSLGAVPFDLRNVYLASGATGKSLGAFAGASLIFADRKALEAVDRSGIPSYLDVAAALASDGPCYTFPSQTLFALETALEEYASPQRAKTSFDRYAELGRYVRQQLRLLGLEPLAREESSCPVVTTFTPPGLESSQAFVKRCQKWRFAIGGQSAYLSKRRLVQIATMGAVTHELVSPLFIYIGRWLNKKPGRLRGTGSSTDRYVTS
jgi:aspartate aminotransferase-like enzyme